MGGGSIYTSVALQERLKETGLLILRIIKLLLKLLLQLRSRLTCKTSAQVVMVTFLLTLTSPV